MSVWLKCRYNSKHPAGVVKEHHHHVRVVKVALYKSSTVVRSQKTQTKHNAANVRIITLRSCIILQRFPTPVGVVTEHHNNVRVFKMSLHKSKQSAGMVTHHYNNVRVVKVPLQLKTSRRGGDRAS